MEFHILPQDLKLFQQCAGTNAFLERVVQQRSSLSHDVTVRRNQTGPAINTISEENQPTARKLTGASQI
jgi:hypothetical protein